MGDRWQAGLLGEAIVSRWLGFHGFEVSTTSSHEDRKGFDLVARREGQKKLSVQVKVDRKASQTGRAYIPITRNRGGNEQASWGKGIFADILIIADGSSWEALVWRRETWRDVCKGLQGRDSNFGRYATVPWSELERSCEIKISSLEREGYLRLSGPDWPLNQERASKPERKPERKPEPSKLTAQEVIKAWSLDYKTGLLVHFIHEVSIGKESPERLRSLLDFLIE
jgi:hypothetical protein